jgi:hypothetical protein
LHRFKHGSGRALQFADTERIKIGSGRQEYDG